MQSIDSDYIKNNPPGYKKIILDVVKYSNVVTLIDKNFIAQHLNDYHEILLAAAAEGHDDLLATIDKEYILKFPDIYQKIALKVLVKSYLSLKDIPDEYIQKNATEYQALALKAIEHQTISNPQLYSYLRYLTPELALGHVKQSFITQYPDRYHELIVAAIKKDSFSLFAIDSGYIARNPELYNELVREAIRQDPQVFIFLDEKKQTMVLEEATQNDDRKKNLVMELKNILNKSKELSQRGLTYGCEGTLFDNSSRFAKGLYISISTDLLRYCQNNISLDQLKKSSASSIEKASYYFRQHRGWKEILFNLGLAIAGLGVGYLAAGLINLCVTKGTHFFFTLDTDSMQKVAVLKQAVDNCGIEPLSPQIQPLVF